MNWREKRDFCTWSSSGSADTDCRGGRRHVVEVLHTDAHNYECVYCTILYECVHCITVLINVCTVLYCMNVCTVLLC